MSHSTVSTAVLYREAARTSRRWQTYAYRIAFSGLMLLILVSGIATLVGAELIDTANMQNTGRYLFYAFTALLMMLAAGLSPLVVAHAMIEERLDGTFDLLVLTPLRPATLLTSKVLSRIGLLLTIVLGALPIMAMVTSLGGVGVDQVVSVGAGAVATTVVMGAMGGYFGLFTRSPLIATLASAGWAVILFASAPLVLMFITLDPKAMAMVSPLFSGQGDYWGLCILLTYLPVLWLVRSLGVQLFQLKVANAELQRLFSEDLWRTRRYLTSLGIFVAASLGVLPVAIGLSWAGSYGFSGAVLGTILASAGRILGLLWIMGLIYLATWFYLRLGMDLVDALDGSMDQMGERRSRRRINRATTIWSNPVAWRESRMSAWASGGLPLIAIWVLAQFVMLQSAVWLIPGALMGIGAANALGAITVAVWVGAGSMEQERRLGTLPALLMTRLSGTRIVLGKLTGAAVSSAPMLLLAFPLYIVGITYFESRLDSSLALSAALRGVGVCLWLVPVWLSSALVALILGMRLKRVGSIYGVAFTLTMGCLLLPAFVAWLFQSNPWLTLLPRLIAPGLSPYVRLWELALSGLGWWALTLGLFVLAARKLRTWGGELAS